MQQSTALRKAAQQVGLRQYITKSRAGHYTVTVRNALGELVYIQDKLPTLEAARRAGATAIAKATGGTT